MIAVTSLFYIRFVIDHTMPHPVAKIIKVKDLAPVDLIDQCL